MEWQCAQIAYKCLLIQTDEKLLYSFQIEAELTPDQIKDKLLKFKYVTTVDYLGYKYTRKRIPIYRFFVLENRNRYAPF